MHVEARQAPRARHALRQAHGLPVRQSELGVLGGGGQVLVGVGIEAGVQAHQVPRPVVHLLADQPLEDLVGALAIQAHELDTDA